MIKFSKIITDKKILQKLRLANKNKIIGLCHGAFDILHHGHLLHLKEAKKNVDILVVSVTADAFIKKGPNQPFNNENLRTQFLIELKSVDYVYLDCNINALDIIKNLKPDLYIKGKDYKKIDITGNLKKELRVLKKYKGKYLLSSTGLMSSTKILNNFYLKNSEVNKYIKKISNKKNITNLIQKSLNHLSNLEVNVIGEPIIDKYIFCGILGVTSKDPAISAIIENEQTIDGGVISVAKIIGKFVKKVNLYTYGKKDILNNYLKNEKNIRVINMSPKNEIQVKSRYINSNRFEKLLQVTNIKKNFFSDLEIKNAIKLIKNIKNNMVICDFGNNFFSSKILNLINKIKIKKYINVQTNSLNQGYNLFTKFKNAEYLSLDDKEWKLGLREEDIKVHKIKDIFGKKIKFSITKGKNGSLYINEKNIYPCPVFTDKAIDTTGCGDAYYAITSLFLMSKINPEIVPFIGNAYASMHSQIIGNSKIVNKINFLKYLNSILKI